MPDPGCIAQTPQQSVGLRPAGLADISQHRDGAVLGGLRTRDLEGGGFQPQPWRRQGVLHGAFEGCESVHSEVWLGGHPSVRGYDETDRVGLQSIEPPYPVGVGAAYRTAAQACCSRLSGPV